MMRRSVLTSLVIVLAFAGILAFNIFAPIQWGKLMFRVKDFWGL